MTENDAIIQLNFDMEMIRFNPETGENLILEQIKARNEDNYNTYLADEVAITALKEIQAYREIGTVDECAEMQVQYNYLFHKMRKFEAIGTIDEFKALKEKSVAKKPIERERNYLTVFDCPTCNAELYSGQRFCDECGQLISDDYD